MRSRLPHPHSRSQAEAPAVHTAVAIAPACARCGSAIAGASMRFHQYDLSGTSIRVRRQASAALGESLADHVALCARFKQARDSARKPPCADASPITTSASGRIASFRSPPRNARIRANPRWRSFRDVPRGVLLVRMSVLRILARDQPCPAPADVNADDAFALRIPVIAPGVIVSRNAASKHRGTPTSRSSCAAVCSIRELDEQHHRGFSPVRSKIAHGGSS